MGFWGGFVFCFLFCGLFCFVFFGFFNLIYNTIRKIGKGEINYYFKRIKHIEFLNDCAYIFSKSVAVPLS